jgi:hypothetical protein
MRILVLILLLAAPLCARSVSTVALDVSAARKLRIEAAVDPAFEHVERKTGLKDDGDLALTLVGNARRFAELASHDGVSLHAENVLGYADARSRRLVLNLAAIDERRLNELGVLRHELAHLVMGHALLSKRPLWFEEGMALWVENMPLDALTESSAVEIAPPSYETLDQLDLGLRDNREAGAAYGQARAVVEFLARRHGEDKLRALLQKLRAPGVGFSAAFAQTTGEELRAFETAALGELEARRQSRFLLFLGANWWWMLFTFAALLAMLAWHKRRKRVKRLVDEWEEQEKLYPSDPSWSYAQDDPTEEFRESLKKRIGERDEEDSLHPPPGISDEGLKHWYDKRREQKPSTPDAPSAEELKKWLEDPKDPTR